MWQGVNGWAWGTAKANSVEIQASSAGTSQYAHLLTVIYYISTIRRMEVAGKLEQEPQA